MDATASTLLADRRVRVLGVEIVDTTMAEAVELVHAMVRSRANAAEPSAAVAEFARSEKSSAAAATHAVYFVNAHTLNTAAADPAYRQVLNAGDLVFGDGTGVRWAARMRGVRLRDNVNGTDFVPAFFAATAGMGYRYFLLGADEVSIRAAADHAARAFPGWSLAGYHHGYLTTADVNAQALAAIRAARADVVLVGMGNPLQERWIDQHRREIAAPVALATGGLFQYWAGTLQRAPQWLRGSGFEWLGILAQQPKKASRYLMGNPLFLARAVRDARRESAARRARHGNPRDSV